MVLDRVRRCAMVPYVRNGADDAGCCGIVLEGGGTWLSWMVWHDTA